MSRASQVCQASSPYWHNKKSVYMTSPLSRDEFLIYSYLHNHGILIPARRDGVFIWKIVPSRQPRSRLQQLRCWEAGQTGRINSMLNFTENLGDAETPSKAGCPSKPSWPGSYKQALNKLCVIFKALHSFLSGLTLKSEKMLE